MSNHISPAEIGDLVQIMPDSGALSRTVVVECLHQDGQVGVFMPIFGGDMHRVPVLCYYNDQQYVVLSKNWKEDLDKARQEKAEADEAARIKPGDFVRITNREPKYRVSGFFPGSVYRVVNVLATGVEVRIEGTPFYFRNNEFEKVSEEDRFDES